MNTNKTDYIVNQQVNSDKINIREVLERYLIHWKLFVLFLIICLSGAYIYLRYTTPQYSATTTILIKDNQKSGVSDELKAVADLGIVGTGSTNNTENEIVILKSRKIVGSVIDSINLDVVYFVEGRIKKTEIYKLSPDLVLSDN